MNSDAEGNLQILKKSMSEGKFGLDDSEHAQESNDRLPHAIPLLNAVGNFEKVWA